ncbi:membrane protein insertase YidC [Candidatus Babeliales bacterium]|nr:membrane protein insertase YidC [Candidatus Babeliales bacterium]
MKIKEFVGSFLLFAGLTLLIMTGTQYFWPETKDAGAFVAPLSKEEQEPLYLEVDFLDNEKQVEEKVTTVSTSYGTYTFSNYGGSLKTLDFQREQNGQKQIFNTIGSHSHNERETRAFLVAIDENTPYYYELKNHVDTDTSVAVSYQAENSAARIQKTFIVYKDLHKMDVTLTVIPKAGHSVRSRLIFPSPYLEVLGKSDFVNAFVVDRTGAFSKRSQEKIDERAGYFTPHIFGSENKYFIHSMIEDKNNFAHRAYYKVIDQQTSSFLEARPVDQETVWTVSFYMGPKTGETINQVAPLLDRTLDYGFLSPLTKGALYLLNVFNKYLGNYGWAILLLTFLLKLILLPFSFSGNKQMQKMQEYSQKMNYLGQKYKDNPEMLAQAKEEFIRKNGLPGIGGCLPLLLQMPVFWILNSALNNSIELYRAPFVFWIQDLSLPDPYFVLPVIGIVGVLLSGMTSNQKATAKQTIMSFGFALLFGAWVSSISAGLALFLVSNTLLHFGQMQLQKVIG